MVKEVVFPLLLHLHLMPLALVGSSAFRSSFLLPGARGCPTFHPITRVIKLHFHLIFITAYCFYGVQKLPQTATSHKCLRWISNNDFRQLSFFIASSLSDNFPLSAFTTLVKLLNNVRFYVDSSTDLPGTHILLSNTTAVSTLLYSSVYWISGNEVFSEGTGLFNWRLDWYISWIGNGRPSRYNLD